MVRDIIPVSLDTFLEEKNRDLLLPPILNIFKIMIPGMSDDFWDKFPEMLITFREKLPGIMLDDFLDNFSGLLYNFLNMSPRMSDKFPQWMWNNLWAESPGLLENFQKKFPGMSDDFWKVFQWFLGWFVEELYADSMLCINYPGGNSCQGDSGGPLVAKPVGGDGVTPGENYEQIGIVSFGPLDNCSRSSWTMYTRVTSILDWMKQTMETETGHNTCGRK